jgi:hypothetical protein
MIVRRVIVSVPDVASSFLAFFLPLLLRQAYMQAAPISPSALRRTRLDWNGSRNVMASMPEASTAGGRFRREFGCDPPKSNYGNKTFGGRSKESR